MTTSYLICLDILGKKKVSRPKLEVFSKANILLPQDTIAENPIKTKCEFFLFVFCLYNKLMAVDDGAQDSLSTLRPYFLLFGPKPV